MKLFLFLFVMSLPCLIFAQHSFKVIPLGVRGGTDESNLSAYLIAATGTDDFICLDAGTIHVGLKKAISNNLFKSDALTILKNNIQAYVISHAHLDHIAGLILNSPEDSNKNIYGLKPTLDALQNFHFNWKTWPNFGKEGNTPFLKKYSYKVLEPGQWMQIENTTMSVLPFVLSHSSPYQSAAFLLKNQNDYILYFGDTGPDELEKSNRLETVWRAVAGLLKERKLKAVFMEVSFPDEQADNALFGHLTPTWLNKEMSVLGGLATKDALKHLNLIVTHIKPDGENEKKIRKQIAQKNKYGINFIFAEQGVLYNF